MANETLSPMTDEVAHLRQQLADTLTHLEEHPEDDSSLSLSLYDLRKEVRHYDAVVSGEISSFQVDSLADIPKVLVDVRRARHMSRVELSQAWGLSEENRQRLLADEENFYAGMSLAGVVSAAIILGAELKGDIKVE